MKILSLMQTSFYLSSYIGFILINNFLSFSQISQKSTQLRKRRMLYPALKCASPTKRACTIERATGLSFQRTKSAIGVRS
jgi:hypothetical protein